MTPPLLLLLSLLAIGCQHAGVESDGSVETLSRYLDGLMPELMQRYGVPGATVAVIRGGELVWSAAYGFADPSGRKKMTVDAVFRVESISKSLTAWAVMRLVAEGRIELDVPVREYLETWQFPPSRYPSGEITTRHLLTHTAGLALGTIGPKMEYPPGARMPSLRTVLSQEVNVVARPGKAFAYSNAGYNLLELLVESVTGLRFSDYMDAGILQPLGMARSGFRWQKSLRPVMPVGHDLGGRPVPDYVYPVHAAGGLLAPVEDIARFVAAEMTGEYFKDVGILTADEIRTLHALQVTVPGAFGVVADGYGFGHFVERLPNGGVAVWHGGQGHGWMSHFHVVPESGDGIVILTNSQRSWPLFAEVLNTWAQWAGLQSLKMGRIRYGVDALRIVIAAVMALLAWLILRLVKRLHEGRCHWEPSSLFSSPARLIRLISGLVVVTLLAWNATRPYSMAAAIFPGLADIAAISTLLLACVVILSALFAQRDPRGGRENVAGE